MVDYNEVLADLRRRKASLKRSFEDEMRELDAAIGAIEKMLPAQTRLFLSTTKIDGITEKASTPFSGMTVREAARRCLEAQGHPMSTSELAHTLLDGGFQTTAKNFRTTVYSTLARDEGCHVEDGIWSLATWDLVKDAKAKHGIRRAEVCTR